MCGCWGRKIMASIVALIPARSGSKRIPYKNIKQLAGHPLIAYTIAAAQQSGVFTDVFVSTDSEEYGGIAKLYGAELIIRPEEYAADNSPDIQWVMHATDQIGWGNDAFSILRPTSPFRQPETIRRAWAAFQLDPSSYDSLRAVERVSQHPNKMWLRKGAYIIPYAPHIVGGLNPGPQPGHSVPTQMLPEVLVQNASLEIAWTKTLTRYKTISGERVLPFFTEGFEGWDINSHLDWLVAEQLIASGEATLPEVPQIERPKRSRKVPV